MAQLSYQATGRRKNATARVRLVAGEGAILVNGRTLDQYFPQQTLQVVIQEPLRLTNTGAKYDVIVRVEGGGIAGQAGAVRHGIARALLLGDTDGAVRKSLKKAGLLTRDPRMKERRKYGLKKARKAPQFSKR